MWKECNICVTSYKGNVTYLNQMISMGLPLGQKKLSYKGNLSELRLIGMPFNYPIGVLDCEIIVSQSGSEPALVQ